MTNYFVISDIHGMYDEFSQLLTHWDQQSELIILGDVVDRGLNSRKVIEEIMTLQKQYLEKVIFLKGNHDESFLQFIEEPDKHAELFLQQMSGDATLESFFGYDYLSWTYTDIQQNMYEQFSHIIRFLKEGRYVYQKEKLLFTHAGFDSNEEDWQKTKRLDFLWMREHYAKPNRTGLVNVFGHTPTWFLHADHSIWMNVEQNYIGIDGGCAFGGQLNALLITGEGEIIEQFVVPSSVPFEEKDVDWTKLLPSLQLKLGIPHPQIMAQFNMVKDQYVQLLLGTASEELMLQMLQQLNERYAHVLSPSELVYVQNQLSRKHKKEGHLDDV